jgi:hypothetical protein
MGAIWRRPNAKPGPVATSREKGGHLACVMEPGLNNCNPAPSVLNCVIGCMGKGVTKVWG